MNFWFQLFSVSLFFDPMSWRREVESLKYFHLKLKADLQSFFLSQALARRQYYKSYLVFKKIKLVLNSFAVC